MGFHHVALATRDTAATHRFYTEVMGFELEKVVVAPTPGDHGGWAKHFFYSTAPAAGADAGVDGGMIAFWEIHDQEVGDGFPVDLNKSLGLPWWVNHIAFDAPTREDLECRRDRWRAHGHTVLEVDHEFCVSIYIRDPNRNMVEFGHTLRPFTPAERTRAASTILDPSPALDELVPTTTVWEPLVTATTPR